MTEPERNIRLVCAPMATLSHEAFRRCIERCGQSARMPSACDEHFTEMINAASLLNQGPYERYYIQSGPVPHRTVWQITGSRPESLARAAQMLSQYGGMGVDINMGCSAPQIYRTGAGISWMLRPLREAEDAVRGVRRALDEAERQTGTHLRLSVKCRLGAEDFTEAGLFSFTDMLTANGVELITLHPRTIKEKYRGLPKYVWAERLAARYAGQGTAVYVNGDVCDARSLSRVMEACPHSAGIMIARAAAAKPWIFAELKGAHARLDAERIALDFIDDVENFQPKDFHRTRLQRFFSYYSQNFSFAHYFRTQMLGAADTSQSRERLMDYFKRQPDDREIEF